MTSHTAHLTLPPPDPAKRRFRWWHEAIVDDMLAFPKATLSERSARLGYKPATLSSLMNSDMLKAAYSQRRQALTGRLNESIAHKLNDNADLTLDIMREHLLKKRTQIPFRDVVEANESLLSRIGYSAPSTVVQVNNMGQGVATSDQLAAARAKLRAVEQAQLRASIAPKAPQVINAKANVSSKPEG